MKGGSLCSGPITTTYTMPSSRAMNDPAGVLFDIRACAPPGMKHVRGSWPSSPLPLNTQRSRARCVMESPLLDKQNSSLELISLHDSQVPAPRGAPSVPSTP